LSKRDAETRSAGQHFDLRFGIYDLGFTIYDLGLFVSLRNATFIFFAHNFFCKCYFLKEYLLNFVVYETRSVALHQYKNHIKP